MIKLKQITTNDKELYKYGEELMTQSFPSDEYRDLNELRQYVDSLQHFHYNIILNDNTPIGILTFWSFEKFHYVEHFAIDSKLRNGGYGQKAIAYLLQQLNHSVVLEVEYPEDEMSERRINFYQRLGFELWKEEYVQPPYKHGAKPLPMYLMVHGDLVNTKDFELIKATLYKEVYGVN